MLAPRFLALAGMAVLMTDAGEGPDDFGVKVIGDLIKGVKDAFDRDPEAPQSAENMLVRFAEALPPIATFLSRLPPLGPKYGNHFNELASALRDWQEGKYHDLFDVAIKHTAASSSQRDRAKANVVLAVEAVKKAGRGFHDEHQSIKTYEEASNEVIREFKLKGLASKKQIAQWRKEFSRRNRRWSEAAELLAATRAYMLKKNAGALLAIARRCGKAALADFGWIAPRER
jgi:hypothetical protein